MKATRQEILRRSIESLLSVKNEAVVYFTRRDLLGEKVDSLESVWNLPEPQRILKKQHPDGSWAGPVPKAPVYPPDHARLVATFKEFRILVEKYRFTRKTGPLEKAAECLLGYQTPDGDIRGFIGNQYATYYTGYILSLLIQAGYADDLRIEKGVQWLLRMRQDDGGWTIPILTRYLDGETMYRLTSSYAEPVEPDRTQPFSHNWTDMVLRAFAVHPVYRESKEARLAAGLLKSRFFKPDVYSSYREAGYWTRFMFWWPNLLTAMESLALLGFPADDPDIAVALDWFDYHVKEDGLWDCSCGAKSRNRSRSYDIERPWISLRICRLLKHFAEG